MRRRWCDADRGRRRSALTARGGCREPRAADWWARSVAGGRRRGAGRARGEHARSLRVSSVACFTWSGAVRSSAERGSGVGLGERHDRGHVVPAQGVDVALEQRLFGRTAAANSGATRRALSSVARARCRALFTATTVVPSSCAASLEEQRSTSQRSNTARCFVGSSSMIVRQAVSIASPVSSSTSGPGSVEAGSRGGSARSKGVRPAHLVQAGVGGDPVQPGAEGGAPGIAGARIARRAATPPAARPRPGPVTASVGSGRAARRGGVRLAR